MGSGSLSSSEVVRFWVGASGERPQFFTRLSVEAPLHFPKSSKKHCSKESL